MSSPGSFDECSMSAGQLPTFRPSHSAWAEDTPELAAIVLHSPSPFKTTQPESWYSFYHPTEGRRLSRSGQMATYRDGLLVCRQSPIQVLTRPSVEWSDIMRYATKLNCILFYRQVRISQLTAAITSGNFHCLTEVTAVVMTMMMMIIIMRSGLTVLPAGVY